MPTSSETKEVQTVFTQGELEAIDFLATLGSEKMVMLLTGRRLGNMLTDAMMIARLYEIIKEHGKEVFSTAHEKMHLLVRD